jgi:ribose/xylose/arabinose/galactoside ABC-type transport system permease subunit
MVAASSVRLEPRRWELLEEHGAVLAVWVVVASLAAFAAVASPTFRTPENLFNVLRQATVLGLISIGQTFVVLTGGIDLSVGSVVKVTAVLTAGLMEDRLELWAGVVLLVLGLGALVGLANGLVVTRLGVAPFIVTLGTFSILRGAALTYTSQPLGTIAEPLANLYNGQVGPVPFAVLFFALVFGLSLLVLQHTALGRHMYAVGGNAEVARLTGLKVERVKLTAFVISGFLAAVAGLMTVSRMGIGDPVVGDGFELDSITAVVLGGTSLFGGRGSVVGTLGGVLLLALVNNVLNLLGVTVWFQGLIKGLIILLAVAVYKQKS